MIAKLVLCGTVGYVGYRPMARSAILRGISPRFSSVAQLPFHRHSPDSQPIWPSEITVAVVLAGIVAISAITFHVVEDPGRKLFNRWARSVARGPVTQGAWVK